MRADGYVRTCCFLRSHDGGLYEEDFELDASVPSLGNGGGGAGDNESVEEIVEEEIDYDDMGGLDDDHLSVASFDADAHDDGLAGMSGAGGGASSGDDSVF